MGCDMSQRLKLVVLLCTGIVWSAGCAAEQSAESYSSPVATSDSTLSPASTLSPSMNSRLPDAALPMPQRQVILNAELTVAVEDIQQANQQVGKLVQEQAALVTRSAMVGSVGHSFECQWTIRVSPPKYEPLLSSLVELGESTHRVESSQDVTAEAVDLDARIRNKTQEESRLLKHLETSTGNLPEILLVEKELSRVREELERMQGQRNLLKDRVDWATINLRLIQHRDLAVVQPVRLFDQIARVWHGSWKALVTVLRFSLLCLLAVLPWVITLGLPAALVWKLLQRRRRVRDISTR